MSIVKFYDRFLRIKNFYIVSDLHLGIESNFNEFGSFLPKIVNKKILEDLININKKDNDVLIINGDIKHDFSKNKIEFKDILEFMKNLKEYWKNIIIIKGNHDNYIKNIANLLKIPVYNRINLKKLVITHGDKLYDDFMKEKKIFIIGNEHPYLKITDLGIEIPVYLINKYLIVIPAFNEFLRGSNILNKDFLSPYLRLVKEKKDDISIITIEDNKKVYLGKLKFN